MWRRCSIRDWGTRREDNGRKANVGRAIQPRPHAADTSGDAQKHSVYPLVSLSPHAAAYTADRTGFGVWVYRCDGNANTSAAPGHSHLRSLRAYTTLAIFLFPGTLFVTVIRLERVVVWPSPFILYLHSVLRSLFIAVSRPPLRRAFILPRLHHSFCRLKQASLLHRTQQTLVFPYILLSPSLVL